MKLIVYTLASSLNLQKGEFKLPSSASETPLKCAA